MNSHLTCTSNRSEVAFTGRNRDLGTFTPIALSKNCVPRWNYVRDTAQHDSVNLLKYWCKKIMQIELREGETTLMAAPAAVSSCKTLIPSTSCKNITVLVNQWNDNQQITPLVPQYLWIGDNFHLKSISFNKPLHGLEIHPAVCKFWDLGISS